MRWVTWEHVGIDRMGSAWLITRRIVPAAVFHFVPAGTKPADDDEAPFSFRACASPITAGMRPFTACSPITT